MQETIERLLSYLRGMWRHRWYALGVAWLICLGGWAYVYKLPDQYQASAQVYLDTQSMLRPLLQGLAVEVNPSAQITLMTRTLLSRANLEKIARMTDLDLRAQDAEAMNSLVTDLRNKIALSSGRRDNMYTITVMDQDPQLARKIVQAALTIFMESTLGETRQDSDSAQRFLDNQISDYEARLVAAENRLKEFKRNNIGLMPGEGGGYYQRMQAAAAALEQAQLALRQAENRRDSLEQQIKGNEIIASGESAASQSAANIELPIDARIQGLEQTLDELLLRYTERHPDIIIIRQTIADLKAQREEQLNQWLSSSANGDRGVRGTNPIYQQLKIMLGQEEANVASLRVQVSEYERRLEELRRMVHTIPEVEAQLVDMDRDYNVMRRNYEILLARREQARLSEQVGDADQGVRFRVVEPPRVPIEPSGPNRPLLMSGILVIGMGGGLGLAFLLVMLWPTVDTRRSLMEITDFPVLGNVGLVLSPAMVRRERLGMLAYASLLACLLTVYAGLVVPRVVGIGIL